MEDLKLAIARGTALEPPRDVVVAPVESLYGEPGVFPAGEGQRRIVVGGDEGASASWVAV